mgnify:CR=1 FL=1
MPRITRTPSVSSSCSSSSESAGAESANFSDWASSLHGARRTKSLFDDNLLDSPEEAVAYDARVHQFNLDQVLAGLSLKDDYARIRLVNYIRKEVREDSCLAVVSSLPRVVLMCYWSALQKPRPLQLSSTIANDHPLFTNDDFLIPVVENDPLLRKSTILLCISFANAGCILPTPQSLQHRRGNL